MYFDIAKQIQCSEADIRAANPNTSFGNPFVAPAGWDYIFPSPQPAHNAVIQRVQEAPPAQTSKGHYEQQWLVVELFETQSEQDQAIADDMDSKKVVAITNIDADTDLIYGMVLGNRAEEYTAALEDASAYKKATYTGTVPIGVSSWATAKSWTPKVAADDIIATAASWKDAQGKIRTTRLSIKEQIKTSTTSEKVNELVSSWNVFATQVKSGLGL